MKKLVGDEPVRIVKSVALFLLVFCTLAVTVVCAAVVGGAYTLENETDNHTTQNILEATAVQVKDVTENLSDKTMRDLNNAEQTVVLKQEKRIEYTPRLLAPQKWNKYYYSDKNVFYESGWEMPNCTAYAWGRAYEILDEKPKLSISDANEWYSYNKENGYYDYGQEPQLGAIACFSYTDRDSGHVAVVEKITEDKLYLSNSAWEGSEFYVDVCDIDDPTCGRQTWEFQGYIYIDKQNDYSEKRS